MVIKRLSGYFQPQQQEIQQKAQQESKKAEAELQPLSSSAVKLAKRFGTEDAEQAQRGERLASLKQAVQDGSYRVDTQEVAKAFLRELV